MIKSPTWFCRKGHPWEHPHLIAQSRTFCFHSALHLNSSPDASGRHSGSQHKGMHFRPEGPFFDAATLLHAGPWEAPEELTERGRSLAPSGGRGRAGAGGGGEEGHLRPETCQCQAVVQVQPALRVPHRRAGAPGQGLVPPRVWAGAGGLCRGRGLFLTPPVTPLASRRSC